MNELQAIQTVAMGMAVVLGMSYEDVLARCTLREALLYVGTTMAGAPAPTPEAPLMQPKEPWDGLVRPSQPNSCRNTQHQRRQQFIQQVMANGGG